MRSIRASGAPSARVLVVVALAAVVGGPLLGCQPAETGVDGSPAESTVGEPSSPITNILGIEVQTPSPGESAAPAAEEAPTDADTSAETDGDDQQSAAQADGEALPGDMLNESESAAAEEAALEAASGVLSAATDRDSLSASSDLEAYSEQPTYRLMYSQRFDTKGDEPRSAEVAYYRYDTNEIVLTRVDLESGEVAPLAVPPGYMAPLLPAEIGEAARAARRDDSVRSALEEDGLDPDEAVANGLLTTLADAGDEVCAATRCVRLFFFGPERIVPNFTVVVDVSNMAVVAIVPNLEMTSHDPSAPAAAGAPDEAGGDPSEQATPEADAGSEEAAP